MYIIANGSLPTPPISPFFDANGNKNIGATIRIGREIWYLPYAGFLNCFGPTVSKFTTIKYLLARNYKHFETYFFPL